MNRSWHGASHGNESILPVLDGVRRYECFSPCMAWKGKKAEVGKARSNMPKYRAVINYIVFVTFGFWLCVCGAWHFGLIRLRR
jgi:hypothetical protein